MYYCLKPNFTTLNYQKGFKKPEQEIGDWTRRVELGAERAAQHPPRDQGRCLGAGSARQKETVQISRQKFIIGVWFNLPGVRITQSVSTFGGGFNPFYNLA